MNSTERRSPAADDAQRGHVFFAPIKSREDVLAREVERCRSMVQASKAERMFLATQDGRRF